MRKLNLLGLVMVGATVSTAAVFAACVSEDAKKGGAGAVPGDDTSDDTTTTPTEGGSGVTADASVGDDDDDAPGPGIDAGGDAGAPPLDVRKLPGLRLWLESTKDLTKAAVGNDFVSWRDSSGRWADGGAGKPDGGTHTAYPIPYTFGGAVNPSVVTNGIAGRPSVTFETGPKMGVANHADFDVDTGDFVIAAVASVSSGTGTFWNLTTATTASSGTWLGPVKFCSFLGAMGAPPNCTSPDYAANTSPHVFVARRKAAQAIYRVDGTSRGTYDFAATNPNLGVKTYQRDNLTIGGGIVAQVSEVVFLVGPTSDASLDALEAHLKTKYAIP